MTFESVGLLIVAIYMVAAGELCCLSDNSGSLWNDLVYCHLKLTLLLPTAIG